MISDGMLSENYWPIIFTLNHHPLIHHSRQATLIVMLIIPPHIRFIPHFIRIILTKMGLRGRRVYAHMPLWIALQP